MVDMKRKLTFTATVSAIVLMTCGITACDRFQSADSLLAEAKQYQQKGDTTSAEIQLKNALQKNPDSSEARYLLGKIYLDAGNAESAENEFRKALSLGMPEAQVRPLLAQALLRQSQFQKVLDETASLTLQGDVVALRGNAYLGLGQNAQAKQAFEAALKIDPNSPQALIGLARSAVIDNDMEDAKHFLDDAIAKNPRDVNVLLFKAGLLRDQGAIDPALAVLDDILKIKPDSVEALLSSADLKIRQKHYDAARLDIAAAQKVAPRNLIPTYMQARVDFSQGKFADALTGVQKVLAVAPDYMPGVLLAGAVQYSLGSMPQAQLNLTKYLDKIPGDPFARKLLTSTLLKSGQKSDAARTLEPLLRGEPQDPEILALAGEISMQNKDFSKASAYFEKASMLAPQSASYHTALGMSDLSQGQDATAITQLETAASLDSKSPKAGILLIMTQLRLHEFDKALAVAATLEKDQPGNPLLQNLKGGAYLGKNDEINARASFEKAFEIDPTYFPAVSNLARLDMKDNHPEQARKRFTAVLEKDKKNISAMTALASLAQQDKHTEEATQWLERAASENPSSLPANEQLVSRYLQIGEKQKALTLARNLQTNNASDAGALELLAHVQFASGDQQGALSNYQRLVTLTPDSAPAQLKLAAVYMSMNKLPEASDAINKALLLQPDFADAEVFQATLYARSGDAAKAITVARQMQKLPTQAAIGHELEGNILSLQKKYDPASQAYAQAFQLDKKNVRLLMKLHASLLQAGKSKDADALAAQWFKDQPTDIILHAYLAQAYLAQKQYKTAIDHYQQVLLQQPKDVSSLNNLAWCYEQEHDPRAQQTAEKAYAIAADNGPVIDTLGWILVQKGDFQRGLPLLQKAFAAAPEATDIHFHLAQALLLSGDKVKARKELEQLLAKGKPFPEMDQAKALLQKI